MADMEILNQMIKDTVRSIPRSDKNGNLCVELREPQVKDSAVTVCNLPVDAIVIKVDEFRSPDTIFKGKKGECKRADYVIISAEKKCIIFIEIKRTKDKWNKRVDQLKGAMCFIEYCREVGKVFWKEKTFLTGYGNRFVSIGHTRIRIDKRPTRFYKNTKLHDTPENAMRIDWPNNLKFNQLIGFGR